MVSEVRRALSGVITSAAFEKTPSEGVVDDELHSSYFENISFVNLLPC